MKVCLKYEPIYLIFCPNREIFKKQQVKIARVYQAEGPRSPRRFTSPITKGGTISTRDRQLAFWVNQYPSDMKRSTLATNYELGEIA
jgi:hypothetical protein